MEGIESLTINMVGGYVNILASDDAINATAGAVAGGAESDDGSYFYMKGGSLLQVLQVEMQLTSMVRF